MWASFTENAKKGLSEASKGLSEATKNITEVMEKTGDRITQAATQPRSKVSASEEEGEEEKEEKAVISEEESPQEEDGAPVAAPAKQQPSIHIDRENLVNNFKQGWSSVVETTKRSIEATEEAIKTQQSRLEQNFPFRKPKGFYKRDPNLPLDVDALRDAEVVYITDRIITMSHPAMTSNSNPSITGERKLAAIGHLLQRRHDGRFLVWNLSEMEYDNSILDDQVLTFSFPGSPSPPLGLLLKLLVSMENWMTADPRNVAVVHCLTGKGRTSTVVAAFLCWMGEAGFGDIHQALAYLAECKRMSPEQLTIPSQRRYAAYFKNMLDGVRPSQPPLLLKRIIMSEAPKFAKGPPREGVELQGDSDKKNASDEDLMGCAPYLQIFKGGKLLFTSAATLHLNQRDEELPFVQVVDGTVPFHVEQIIQGDILVRCRHLTFNKQRVSMFRAAFHTGYVPPNVLRLTKSQLDGACNDPRFPDDFFLDLIFEKVDSETATKHVESETAANEESAGTAEEKPKTPKKGPVVEASEQDSMLQGESRFWDVILARRQAHAAQQEQNQDPNFGPTVGRRRGESQRKKMKAQDAESKAEEPSNQDRKQLETFSIGNEFDFLPKPDGKKKPNENEPQRDSLMDALNALDDEDGGSPAKPQSAKLETEEVVFETNDQTRAKADAATNDQDQSDPAGSTDGAQSGAPSDAAVESVKDDESSKASTTAKTDASATVVKIEDDDMDALLALSGGDEDLGDVNLEDFDVDGLDDDLEDLENMLKL